MFNIARLLPAEGKFYRLIDTLAATAGSAAGHLKTFVESKDPKQKAEASAAISQCRRDAKAAQGEVTRELCLTFITPFDREDIQSFASHLYKICKLIDKARGHMELHGLSDIGELSGQTDLLVQEAEAMKKVVNALTSGATPERIMAEAAPLDTLENRGDEILNSLLVRLLSDAADVRLLILKKDVYDMLERAIDKYRDAAGVALQIALKHT
jgi:uncharacterized protein Yka (UPF0111/DUF47 family)